MIAPMTPAEIAAKMTTAQSRALRNPSSCSRTDFDALLPLVQNLADNGMQMITYTGHTDLGRAVLAVLDGGDK